MVCAGVDPVSCFNTERGATLWIGTSRQRGAETNEEQAGRRRVLAWF